MWPFLLALALGSTLVACDRKEPVQAEPAPAVSPRLLEPGSAVPPLSVDAQDGQTLDLGKLGKPAVVYFYPKDDTPGCTVEATEIRDLWTEIEKTGAIVIGISSDGEASHRAFAEKYDLPFLLVPDEDHALANAFGVPVKDGKAARTSFVLGTDGHVLEVFSKVNPRGHGAQLLAALSR